MKKKIKTKLKKYIFKLAKKGYIFKPLVFSKMYGISKKKTKKLVNENIDRYIGKKEFSKMSKKEQKNLRCDIVYSKIHYNIGYQEYFLFGFKNKTNKEKKAFIPNAERKKYLRLLGTEKGRIILNDKYESYKYLKDFYKRDMIKISTDKDYKDFEKYVKKHPVFVIKPIASSLGKGVKLVDSAKYKNNKELFKEIISKGETIIEEQIISDEKMASLHPQSLNTVRIVTYRDNNDNVFIHLPFIKIGQGGAFVDNGGAGGMLALIDPKNGIIKTNAKDENNVVFEKHPNTKVKIKGFEIPKWDEMISLAKEAALSFPYTRYIGFDIALSKDKGPVIIEGNSRTQFYGQQIPDEVGKKKDLEKLINYKKLKKDKKKKDKDKLKNNKEK